MTPKKWKESDIAFKHTYEDKSEFYSVEVQGRRVGRIEFETFNNCENGRGKEEITTARVYDLEGNDAEWFPPYWFHSNQDTLFDTVFSNARGWLIDHLNLQAEGKSHHERITAQ